MNDRIHPFASLLAAVARGITGVQVQWAGCEPDEKQRIYFAKPYQPSGFRGAVVGASFGFAGAYATRGRAGLLGNFGTATLRGDECVQRRVAAAGRDGASQKSRRSALCWTSIDRADGRGAGRPYSLILFPEGTRGNGEKVGSFRAGLYHLALRRPDVELVPAYLENMNRILPKGEVLPVPMLSLLTFGKPLQVEPGEEKETFLERAREAVSSLRRIGSA